MTDTLESLATILVEAVEPLRRAVSDLPSFRAFLHRLGWRVESLPPEYQQLGTQVDNALNSLEALREGTIDVNAVIANVKGLYEAIKAISAAPSGVDEAAFLADLRSSLFDLLVTDYLASHTPVLFNALRLTGGIDREYRSGGDNRPPSFVYRLRLEEMPRLLDDPREAVGRALGWGTSLFDFHLLAEFLLALLAGLRISSSMSPVSSELAEGFQRDAAGPPGAPIEEQLIIRFLDVELAGERSAIGVSILELPAEGSKLPGILIRPLLPVSIPSEINAGEFVKIVIRSGSQLDGAFGVAVEPDGISVRYPFDPAGELPPGGFGTSVVYQTGEPITLLGRRDRANLTFSGATASVTLDRSPADVDFKVSLSLDGLKLTLPRGEGDSFLRRLTGDAGATVPMQFQLQWSSRTGLGFAAGAGFEFSTATYLSLGPISIHRISFAVRTTVASGHSPDLVLTAGVSMTATLGPLTVVLDDIGVRASVVVEDGNVGPFDVSAGFKAPDGLGLVVDAGPVTGGGFLAFNSATGQYTGAAELEVYDISVKAIGFLDTRIPGGSPPYSFFLLVSADFAPIPLGFGFMLKGVGGLAGIHRSINVDELRNRFRTGSLNDIFFERDPIKNAGRLVTDLQAVFPPAENRYVFGPMAIIGWGTPTLVEGRLAVILELPQPARLVILAFLSMALPRRDEALIKINLDLFGEVDPERKRISLDGRLRESYVLGFAIEGEMAMRLQGGPQPSFALAIGGFNPGFKPPPGFPQLKRITIPIGIDDNPRITIEGYLALTSNTLQVGASAALYAEAGWFNITGSVGFHALFTFVPFSFVTDFCGRVTLRQGSNDLAGIKLEAKISGITPWRAAGEACLEIRWFPDICVGFDASFGGKRAIDSPVVDPWPVLRDAIANIENWSGVRPVGVFRGATIGSALGSPVTFLDPAFGASVRQTVVPLSRTITKFGEAQPPGGSARFDVASVTEAGTTAPDVAPIQEFFAAAQFEQMTNDQKLSRPSFEKMDAGIVFAQDAISHGTGVLTEVEFETKIIDSTVQTRGFGFFFPSRQLQVAAARRVSFARTFVDRSGRSKFAPPPAQPPLAVMNEETFVIASAIDLEMQAEIAQPSGKGAVSQVLDAWLAARPQDRGRLQVMSAAELARGGDLNGRQ